MGESCKLVRYVRLSNTLKKIGYIVIPINPDWKKPLTKQIIKINSESIIFGFSMGAVLAYLIIQKIKCKKAIFASISPVNTFYYETFQKFLSKHMTLEESIAVTKDILSIKVRLNKLKTPYVTLMGGKEKIGKNEKKPDFIIPGAAHKIDKIYLNGILKLL